MDDDQGLEAARRHRAERVARNESAARRYNRRRERFELRAIGEPGDDLVPFVCECADLDCVAAIMLTIAEFDSAHDAPDRFVVKPGHVVPEVERLIDETDRYWVVSKPILQRSAV